MEKRKLCIWDFDATLVLTPMDTPENREKWSNYHGKPYPYLGWWGRDESMDTNIWEMPVVQEVFNDYQKEVKNPENLMVLLTGRQKKQESIVRNIVNKRGYYFDYYLFNTGGRTLNNKINHLNNLLSKYPNIREVELWDDRVEHFESFELWGQKLIDIGRIDYFHLNKIKSEHW